MAIHGNGPQMGGRIPDETPRAVVVLLYRIKRAQEEIKKKKARLSAWMALGTERAGVPSILSVMARHIDPSHSPLPVFIRHFSHPTFLFHISLGTCYCLARSISPIPHLPRRYLLPSSIRLPCSAHSLGICSTLTRSIFPVPGLPRGLSTASPIQPLPFCDPPRYLYAVSPLNLARSVPRFLYAVTLRPGAPSPPPWSSGSCVL